MATQVFDCAIPQLRPSFTGSNNRRIGICVCLVRKTVSTEPRDPFYQPSYQPPPNDQRVRHAVNAADQERLSAEEAKRKFEAATGEVRKRLQEDNQLKDALLEQLEINRKLRERLEIKPKASPSPSQSSSSTDALKQWGEQSNRQNGPTPAGTQ
jgi:hypothetical protein